jgi:hypothetical protein
MLCDLGCVRVKSCLGAVGAQVGEGLTLLLAYLNVTKRERLLYLHLARWMRVVVYDGLYTCDLNAEK